MKQEDVIKLVLAEIVKKKYGYLDAEEFNKKMSEVYTDIVSFLLYHYVKGLDADGKKRVRKMKTEMCDETFVYSLLEEVTAQKAVLMRILSEYKI